MVIKAEQTPLLEKKSQDIRPTHVEPKSGQKLADMVPLQQ